MDIQEKVIGKENGADITQLLLKNDRGLEVAVLTTGATLQAFYVPTKGGGRKNIVLGFDDPLDYYRNGYCAGQSIGRVAGRIGKAYYEHAGVTYTLPVNEGENCHHGGPHGMQTENWSYETAIGDESVSVTFSLDLTEQKDRFPGDMKVSVRYCLDNTNRLSIRFTGSDSSADTLFNPTNHVYFNLGEGQDLDGHYLRIAADQYLELGPDLVPTGQKLPVEGTAYDFRQEADLAERILQNDGFDDAFVVAPSRESRLREIASLREGKSGDRIAISSDRNGLVIYSMEVAESDVFFARDQGKAAQKRQGLAMEAQWLPDAVNHPDFGDCILPPGETRQYEIIFHYSQKNQED